MNTDTTETAPNASDDRLMDALLREQARLGTRDDEALLAHLEKAMAEEPAAPPPPAQAPRRKPPLLWPWVTAAAAVLVLSLSPLFQTPEPPKLTAAKTTGTQAGSTTVATNTPAPGMVRNITIVPPTSPTPPLVTDPTLAQSSSAAPATPNVFSPTPYVDYVAPQSGPAPLSGKLGSRGAPHGIGDGGGDGQGPGSGQGYAYAKDSGRSGGGGLAPKAMSAGGGGRPPSAAIGRAVGWAPSEASDRAKTPLIATPSSFAEPQLTQNFDRNSERYGQLVDNPWRSPVDEALSTFSVDVDTASYSNFRRLVQNGQRLPADALRLEEMVNYFDYDYPEPEAGQPFSVGLDAAVTPWNPETRLVRVALHGREVARLERPPANLVFLIDVSGSMNEPDKLPLVIESFQILLEELKATDTLSIVVYAGAEGLALPPTTCNAAGRKQIAAALKRLSAGGSTNGGAGISLAYKLARKNFKEGGINRVILATDGDFNVGNTSDGGLVALVEQEAKSKVFLTVLGFGTGNLNDSMLEAITNKGNGTYHYIDCLNEARRVFLQKMMATLMTIAKDVKVQVEFNPAQVSEYRLLGYANRMLNKEDFNNDRVDAGDIGAGHTVTALYEIRPGPAKAVVDPLKYGPKTPAPATLNDSKEWMTVKLRYKEPEGDTSKLITRPFSPENVPPLTASPADFRFATSVALTASLLRETSGLGDATLRYARTLATGAQGNDPHGLRAEFTALLDKLILSKGER